MSGKRFFQENAADPEPMKQELSEDQKLRMQQVEEVLGMPGYGILNGLMNQFVEHYTRRAMDLGAEEKDIRYAQGAVNVILDLRSTFLRLSKEEGYVG